MKKVLHSACRAIPALKSEGSHSSITSRGSASWKARHRLSYRLAIVRWLGILFASFLCLGSPSNSLAWLGGFEFADGYIVFSEDNVVAPNPDGSNSAFRNAVEFYNAGRFGPNAGGSSYSPSGANSASAASGWTSPLLGTDGSNPSGNDSDDEKGYVAKHKYTSVGASDRFGDDQGHFLGFSASSGINNYVEYEYTFDQYDFGNVVPSTMTNGDVHFSIYACPSSLGTVTGPATDSVFHTMSFYDSSGQLMLQLGTGERWTSSANGTGNTAASIWSRTGVQAALTSHSVANNGYFMNKDGWSKWDVTFHLSSTGADSVTVKVTPGQDAGAGITQSFFPQLTVVDHAPLIGNINAASLAKWKIGSKGGGNKYYYEDAAASYAPASLPCSISAISLTGGTATCNDNGTPLVVTDDYFTSNVTITFADKPATGNLVLSGAALHSSNTVSTVAVGSTTSATTHTFTGVRLKANNTANPLIATFSADSACTLTQNTTAVPPCSSCPTITVTPSPLPNGTVSTPYTGSPSASGGASPYSWTATNLPAGLAITIGTGAITGTPTASGTATITATDANGCSGTTTLTINVSSNPDYNCIGSLLPNSSLENGNFSAFTTPNPSINGTLVTYGGSQAVFLSGDSGGSTEASTPITGFRANTGYWVDAASNGGGGAMDGNRLFVIPADTGANKCLWPDTGLGVSTTVNECYRICFWAAQIKPSSPNNAALNSQVTFEFGDTFGATDPGTTSNYSITPASISESGSWNTIVWNLPASTAVKDLAGAPYTGAVGQVIDWRTLNWQRICFDFTPLVASNRIEGYFSTTSQNNGVALDGFCIRPCGVATCTISAISMTGGTGTCSDNGTPAVSTDDYFTSDITVTFADKPASGNLDLSGAALHSSNTVSTVAVGSTTSATTHTFTSVRLKANNIANTLTATFSADTACTFTQNTSAVPPCSVASCPTITVTPGPLASGTVGTAYTASPSASGGATPYTWTATSLPAGLAINASTGAITGTPTATGNATITATDANNCTSTTTLVINPFACPVITVNPTLLSPGSVGQAYSQTPTASGAPSGSNYTWSASGLPTGLSINATTGAITGTPTVAGTATITAAYTNSGSTCTGTATLMVNSGCCPQLTIIVP